MDSGRRMVAMGRQQLMPLEIMFSMLSTGIATILSLLLTVTLTNLLNTSILLNILLVDSLNENNKLMLHPGLSLILYQNEETFNWFYPVVLRH
jgi:hypothetical protein